MINKNELRINNWVYRKTLDTYQQVIEILSTRVLLEHLYREEVHGYMAVNLKSIDPIPLSPEILEMAGFNTNGVRFWLEYSINGQVLYIDLIRFKKAFCLLPTGELDIKGTRIKYVHQLQNLYFALTGEELNIENLN